ncbi:TetR family transcriptional regulator [Bogoriella caseilytica]|uniref:TetR family transcriptional regulator n=2 Tax=Bogoriella caseilytica TaxID=56055 RepID=A0A3N2BDA4_9MICO|nr:TetR family transcriptional regulator [Bogoriella caseilytica]
MGLRELKKQMTRQAITNAALRLTREKGLDSVTVDEIAREAFVSPRTVSNYFTSKEEAVLSAGALDWRSVIEEFARDPRTERPLEVMCELMCQFIRARPRDELELLRQSIELVDANPSLRSYQSAAITRLEDVVRDLMATRTGIDPATHMYPWLVAAAAGSAVRSALRLWEHSGADADRLPELIEEAFGQISAGLPAPQE